MVAVPELKPTYPSRSSSHLPLRSIARSPLLRSTPRSTDDEYSPLRSIPTSPLLESTVTSSSRGFSPPRFAAISPLEASRERLLRDRLSRRSEEHTSELQSRQYLVCRLLL